MTKERRIAEEILEKVGGKDNLEKVIHCMTRVRMRIVDYNKVDIDGLKAIDGVMGIVEDDMLQVVVGPGTVNKVANEMSSIIGVPLGEEIKHSNLSNKERVEREADLFKSNLNRKNDSKLKRILRSIANIFVPLIPAFVGAGLIGGIAAVLSNLIVGKQLDADTWQMYVDVLNVIKNGLFAYLTVYVGINAAKEFGATPGLGGVIGGTTL